MGTVASVNTCLEPTRVRAVEGIDRGNARNLDLLMSHDVLVSSRTFFSERFLLSVTTTAEVTVCHTCRRCRGSSVTRADVPPQPSSSSAHPWQVPRQVNDMHTDIVQLSWAMVYLPWR